MKPKHHAGLTTMRLVIDQMTADTVDEDTTLSLKNMLTLSTFDSLHDCIQKKLAEIKMAIEKKPPVPVAKESSEHIVDMTFLLNEAFNNLESVPEEKAEVEDNEQLYEYENPHSFHNTINFLVTGKAPEDGFEL